MRVQVEDENAAQIQALDDTWRWTATTAHQYDEVVVSAPGPGSDALTAFRTLLGENVPIACVGNMAPRLV